VRIRPALLWSLLLVGTVVCAGDYYKWTDSHGTVHYSQTPPPGQAADTIYVNDGAPVLPPPGIGYQEPTVQQRARLRANRAVLQKTDVQASASDCATARSNIGKLQHDKPLAKSDATDVRALTPEQRVQALADARAQVKKYCLHKQ
jgi:hypothetical protein